MTRLGGFLRDESGTASIEFIFVFPIFFMLFTASIESSLYMARFVMMERAVDIVVRNIRLGRLDDATHDQLKSLICNTGMLITTLQSCKDSMRIWMQPVSTASFGMNPAPNHCVDKSQPVNNNPPGANEYKFGVDDEIMLMRICIKEEPMFPTTAISVKMPVQADGSYAMIVSSVFVNEPG
jgi:TadE-like protein